MIRRAAAAARDHATGLLDTWRDSISRHLIGKSWGAPSDLLLIRLAGTSVERAGLASCLRAIEIRRRQVVVTSPELDRHRGSGVPCPPVRHGPAAAVASCEGGSPRERRPVEWRAPPRAPVRLRSGLRRAGKARPRSFDPDWSLRNRVTRVDRAVPNALRASRGQAAPPWPVST